jgi:type I restriction enzyme S subunit
MTEGGDRDKLGRGTVWNNEIDPCLHQNHVFALTTDNSRLDVHYLDYVTTSKIGRDYFDYTAKKTTNLASTNSTAIMQFRIPIPPIEEQHEIVRYLDKKVEDINRTIRIRESIISKLTEYKKSLIYEVVTGKKEV